MSTSDRQTIDLMLDDPPWWLVLVWLSTPLLTIATVILSYRAAKEHMRAATAAGFGNRSSFGPRGNKVLFLLSVPAMFSATSLIQVFYPGTEDVSSFLRTCIFGLAAAKSLKLTYLLAGGKHYIESAMSEEPIKAFNQVPCCCLCCWPCCARPPKAKICGWPQKKIMLVGIYQFVFGAPILGLYVMLAEYKLDEEDIRGMVLTGISAISTLWCMWSFKCLSALTAPVVTKLVPEYKPAVMGKLVVLQMALSQLLDLVLQNAVRDGYDNGSWVLERDHVASIVGGCTICVFELFLCLLGSVAFPAADLYPNGPDIQGGLPLDMIAQLELDGVDPAAWNILAAFSSKQPTLDVVNVLSAMMELSGSHPATVQVESPQDKPIDMAITSI